MNLTNQADLQRIEKLLPSVEERIEKKRILVEKKLLARLTFLEQEEELTNLQEQLCLESVYSNPSESQRVNGEIKKLEDTISQLYEEWESLV